MFNNWIFKLRNTLRRLSVRAALFACLGVITSLAGVLFSSYVPDDMAQMAGGNSVDSILKIVASSMLMVITFALSTMVSAYSAATQVATPRATSLIMDDVESHSAISMFLGAFIYSVVSLIGLSTKFYGNKGRVILLGVTILVLISVVWVIIRWVSELKNMGRVHETIKRVEERTSKAFEVRSKLPTFGCHVLDKIPTGAHAIYAGSVGHLQNIDIEKLGKISMNHNVDIYVENDIGSFIYQDHPLAHVQAETPMSDELATDIQSCFIIGTLRTFENDPRYGIIVLSGIASKALSPSLNDPGTAIDVVGSLVRVLSLWSKYKNINASSEIKYNRVFYPELYTKDVFNDAFFGIAKDGIGHMTIVKSLQGAYENIKKFDDPDFKKNANDHLRILQQRVRSNYEHEIDLKWINDSEMIGENQRECH